MGQMNAQQEFRFLLHDLLQVDEQAELRGFSELTPDLTGAIIGGISEFAAGVLEPLNAVGDQQGCHLENGIVRTPAGFAKAYQAYCAAGWSRLAAAEAYGGTDMPEVLGLAATEIVNAANPSFALYPGLTYGAMSTVERAGSDWMRAHIVPKMVSGEWTGTMCLTEAHCGTDLKLMNTRATELPDGTFQINGTKIFISGGDHDLADNIIHLVLAKLPDADGKYVDDLATVALFLVPKFAVAQDGSMTGVANGVSTGGVEHKMGLKGSATCVLNFDGAIGLKLNSSQKGTSANSKSSGMSAMFEMMNHARLETGIQAMATATAAYAKSADYARERLTGRAFDPAARTAGRADPIIVHPDVRRMLLKQASFLEGARGLALWVAMLLDTTHRAADPAQAKQAGAMASLLTPVIKAFFTDRSFECTNLAVQVYGGHGYISDNGVEQHVRDSRIFQLYEGANGIQALDLVMRKLPAEGGQAFADLIGRIEDFLVEHQNVGALATQLSALRSGIAILKETAGHLRDNGADAQEVASAAYDTLNIFGIVVIGYIWAWIGAVSVAKLADGQGDAAFYRRKLVLGSYWAEREMPLAQGLLNSARGGAATLMALPADAF
jgi:alkylation response protein AidB-like acyl-CoA dehydrogenase